MPASFKDYYSILGVPRTASPEEIKRAFRKKAREWHPDRNQAPGAEERFKEVNEAYEVLGDPEKKTRYDQLGTAWQNGAPFEPPPGFGGFSFDFGNLQDLMGATGRQGRSGFSDFFEMLFGDPGEGPGREGGRSRSRGRPRSSRRGGDLEAEVELPLSDFLNPGQRRISVDAAVPGEQTRHRGLTVNLPRGLRPGQKLRLPAQGAAGSGGGPAGDVFLRVRAALPAGVSIEGDDLVMDLAVPAPRAVVGGTATLQSPEGPLTLRLAPGTAGGTLLRVRRRGLMRADGSRGDLLVRVTVTIPEHPTPEELDLYRQLDQLPRS